MKSASIHGKPRHAQSLAQFRVCVSAGVKATAGLAVSVVLALGLPWVARRTQPPVATRGHRDRYTRSTRHRVTRGQGVTHAARETRSVTEGWPDTPLDLIATSSPHRPWLEAKRP